MTRRHSGVPRRVLLTWFMLAGGILLVLPHSTTCWLQFRFLDLFRLPIRSGHASALAALTAASTGGAVAQNDYQKVTDQNRQLRNHIDTLEAAMVQQQQKIDQLTGLRQVKSWERMAFLPADAVTRTTPHHLLINRGTADHLSKGQLVMADNAIIGTISELGTHTARVELVTSPTSKLRVAVSAVQGVLCGEGNNLMEIPNLAKPPQTVTPGQPVYVQKIPGLLDALVVVGTVVQWGRDDQNPMLWEIKVQPSCDLDHVSGVWVIVLGSP